MLKTSLMKRSILIAVVFILSFAFNLFAQQKQASDYVREGDAFLIRKIIEARWKDTSKLLKRTKIIRGHTGQSVARLQDSTNIKTPPRLLPNF